MEQQPKSKLTYSEMLNKLDDLYGEKELLEDKLTQLQYDIEFLENMIMYRYVKSTPSSNQSSSNQSNTEFKKKEWHR